MKNNYLSFPFYVLLGTLSIFLNHVYYSQCDNGVNFYPASTHTPTTGAWTSAATNNWAGEVIIINVTAGDVYEFSTCSSYGGVDASYDTQLTLRQTDGTLLAYNDDYAGCGLQSYLNWTSTITGEVYLHLNQYDCASNNTNTQVMIYRTAAALDFIWTGLGDPSNWDDPNNWNVLSPPAATKNCIIPISPAGPFPILSFPGTYSCKDLEIESGMGSPSLTIMNGVELDIAGDLTDASGLIIIDGGKLDIAGDAIFSRSITLTTATSEIEVDGATTLGGDPYVLDIGDGTFDVNGVFNGSTSPISFNIGTSTGQLILAGAVSSLGALNSTVGTVVYDGSAQTIVSDNYFNLKIETAGTKTVGGNLDVDGDLSIANTASCKMDLDIYALNLAGNLTVGYEDGLDASDAACIINFDGVSSIVTHAGNVESSAESSIGSNITDYAISSLSTTTSSIVLANSLTTDDLVSITVNLTHTWDADLEITLIAPNGTSIDLSSDNGAGGDDYTNTVFQTGGTAITSGSAPFTGTYAPEQAFSNLSGTANGTWTLSIYDDAGGDEGILNDWSISLNGSVVNSINPTFQAVSVNGPDITLADPIDITGTLTLSNGNINSDVTNRLTIKSGGIVSGGSSSSHVAGPMDYETASTSEITIPIGDGERYRPVYITPIDANATTFSSRFISSSYSDLTCTNDQGLLDHVAPGMYWDISNNGGSNANIGLSWDENIYVTIPEDMRLAHWNGTAWEKVGDALTGSNGSGSAVVSDGRVTGSNINDFSPFNLGSSGSGNPLPIDLLSFIVDCSHDIVDVNFSVISQVNNDYFLIERSADAEDWQILAKIEGAGNSNSQLDYNFVDGNPMDGLSYYRLSQVDFNGHSKIFSPVSVSCVTVDSGLPIVVYPNPVVNEFTIELELDQYQGEDVYYNILDARGAIIQTDKIELLRGFNQHLIDVQNIPNGVYVLSFINTKVHISQTRIVKR